MNTLPILCKMLIKNNYYVLFFFSSLKKWTSLPFVLDKVDPRLRDETLKAHPRGPTTTGETKPEFRSNICSHARQLYF